MRHPPVRAVAYPAETDGHLPKYGKGMVMSEDTTVEETVEETPADPAPEEQEKQETPDFQAEAKKWKSIALKHEAKAKELEGAAEKLKALETQNMSETEKLQAAVKEFQEKERAANIKALKLQVAADKEMPKGLARFLPDTDNEIDMVEAADELLEAAGQSKMDPPSRKPKSSLNHPLGDDTDNEGERLLNAMLGKPAR